MKDSGVVIVTGAGGLVGVESVNFFSKYFEKIIGVDNDSRGYFFGKGGSVAKNIEKLRLDHRAVPKAGAGDHTDLINYKEALRAI